MFYKSDKTKPILFFQMLGKQTKSALAIPVPSDKEPAGRRASGLAHLMTALHQNAAAVVNSKTQLNGPDQVRVLRSGYTEGQKISKAIYSILNSPKNEQKINILSIS